ncbi:MAG: pyridoxamine 5'-phosphate oxidase [Fimbriimonadaceae bacterium]|nr:pyridoxamine 5'-phosphate oxidase [Chitinophagales bacterium]
MIIESELNKMRENYEKGNFNIENAYPSPFNQFEKWFEDAKQAKIIEPNAMVLSTATKNGMPSSRVVLLKGYSEKGFIFFTNYNSRKGKELFNNPYACLNLWWGQLERQIRIEGIIEKIDAKESDEYFYSRPLGSQAGAATSPQSEKIESREWLEKKFIETQLKGNIKRPENWGGYILIPNKIEFWHGRTNRLHDRLLYTMIENEKWKIVRLAP